MGKQARGQCFRAKETVFGEERNGQQWPARRRSKFRLTAVC